MESNRQKGKIKHWDTNRGFGFIQMEGKKDVFIHISALKGMSRSPVLGDIIDFQLGRGKNGRTQAVNATIEGVAPISKQKKHQSAKSQYWLIIIILLIIVGMGGFYLFTQPSQKTPVSDESTSITTPDTQSDLPMSQPAKQQNLLQNYTCEGKQHCSEMKSCEEAKFYILNCPDTKMDSDNDGIPCESQWCNS